MSSCQFCKELTPNKIYYRSQSICPECYIEVAYGKILNQNIHFCGNYHYVPDLPGGYYNALKLMENKYG